MNVIKKLDDVGRITIPRDIRRSLRWMDGDEIEIIFNNDGTLLLRKHENDTIAKLRELQKECCDTGDVNKYFNELIALLENKN